MFQERKHLATETLTYVLLILTLLNIPGFTAEIRVPEHYPTLTEALALAQDGDMIQVQSGVYSVETGEQFPLYISKSISIIGDSESRPHLLGDKEHTVILIETGGVTLQGLQITDGLGSEGINRMDGGGICIFVGPTETTPIVIEDCQITHNTCPSDETYDGSGGGIYCGGTYCTCFETQIKNCLISDNSIHGQGGGVCCAMLSNVAIAESQIQDNQADDQGGGVFVDVFASLQIQESLLQGNQCPGDSTRQGWGGKGGALACESYGLFSIIDSEIIGNKARYYGGGVFTGSSITMEESTCGSGLTCSQVAHCRIEKNRSDYSGGGLYVAGYGILNVANTTLYWNSTWQNGGALYVAEGANIYLSEDCLLEGNESGNQGGGIYLDIYAAGTFDSMDLLGNTSLKGGGGIYLAGDAVAIMTNCLVAYNNCARGWGGGIRAAGASDVNLTHCSVVGNFALNDRSGLYLDNETTTTISDSILWHNAGGSIGGANETLVTILSSLNEDYHPNLNPRYVGWGDLTEIYVYKLSSDTGDGTPDHPYYDLQQALNGFDFRLGADSPCLGTAGDGGNLGANTGVGGNAGNTKVVLDIAEGQYDIRGRNIIFIQGIQGSGPDTTTITNAVFGHVNEGTIQSLSIAKEDGGFGGITLRAGVHFVDCHVYDNGVAVDGAGIYVAQGDCLLTDSKVWGNICGSGYGGGIYLKPQTSLELISSGVENNRTYGSKAGGIYAGTNAAIRLTDSKVSANVCGKYGGGLFLESGTITQVVDSNIVSNKACQGAGFYVLGALDIKQSNIESNRAEITAGSNRRGGGLYINGIVSINNSTIANNYALRAGGGIFCNGGKTSIEKTTIERNYAKNGGGLNTYVSSVSCKECIFKTNTANEGGAVDILRKNITPLFDDCEFIENTGQNGGAAMCFENTKATFNSCFFKDNRSRTTHGGSLYLKGSQTTIRNCQFQGGSAVMSGGTGYITSNDRSVFENCSVEASVANAYGGAFCVTGTATPAFTQIEILGCQAINSGGGLSIHSSARPTFIGVVVDDCQAIYGGGMYACANSESLLQQCTFSDNRAYELTVSADGGGSFLTENAKGTFQGCLFQGNTAQDDGGGLAVAENAGVDLKNTLLASNAAVNDGGGIHFTSKATGTLLNCTLVSNQSIQGGTGGGIYLEMDNRLLIDSCIICQNSPPDGIRPDANPTVQYSCTQKLWAGLGNRLCEDGCLLDPAVISARLLSI
ncbi:DUF1565 domain-containing protein, partial [Planctomycetota bacterium]